LIAQELMDAKKLVQDLWEIKYASITLLDSVVVENRGGGSASEASNVSKRAPIITPIRTNED
jgi:hypothetical protein